MIKKQKVWLIGASGFTGEYLVSALNKKGYSVDQSTVDITDLQQVDTAMQQIQPNYIINLAAISFVPDGENESIYAVNTFGPQNILTACLNLSERPKKIILVSSANVYGIQEIEQLDEEAQPNPVNHYGCSKWSMEQIAKTYSDRLDITVTRPFNYTGHGQHVKFLVPKIVEHFKSKADVIKLGNIDVWRDFSDVRWVAAVYAELLTAPKQDDLTVINVCSGRLLSIRNIIETLQRLTQHTIRVETDQEFVRNADIKKQCGNNKELFKMLPNLPEPIEFKQTLQWMSQEITA